MSYIKSYSNYVLKSKHKLVNEGTIYERDAVTIGGKDSFAAHQAPIYRSGNFLITVNADTTPSRFIKKEEWFANGDGESWSYKDVVNASADTEFQDNHIVLKYDYYDLADMAYFGSCSELIRGSITHVLKTFPGELYAIPNSKRYYFDNQTEEYIPIGQTDEIVLDNPFNIDLHSEYVNEQKIEDKLKYFANNLWQNYEIIFNDNTYQLTSYTLEHTSSHKCCAEGCDNSAEFVTMTSDPQFYCKEHRPTNLPTKHFDGCVGELMYTITLQAEGLDDINIYVYRNQNNGFTYMVKSNLATLHIRPKASLIDDFFNSLDMFESLLFNRYSDPLYTAMFRIIKENDYGYYKTLDKFSFPLGEGGYNLSTDQTLVGNYLSKLLEVGEFYDSRFCDNMYRIMTHEPIKNFDWTYNINSDDKESYEEGANKIAKLIRIFAREFDEIKHYIDGISAYNTITYNDNNNLPDYFLTDELDVDGWDILNTYPYQLSEYVSKDDNTFIRQTNDNGTFNNTFIYEDINGNKEEIVLNVNEKENVASDFVLNRLFSQDIETTIKPYTNNVNYPNGYYYKCTCDPMEEDCISGGYDIEEGTASLYWQDKGCVSSNKPVIRRRIKKYVSDKEYSYKDINVMFLKRLKLNSRALLKSKGTVDGVEMMLGLFGMRSQKYVDALKETNTIYGTNNKINCFEDYQADYSITEYTTFTNGIEDPFWFCKDMTRIDYYNQTKTIPYNTIDFRNGIYVPYQGLPLSYRNRYYLYVNHTVSDEIDDIQEVVDYNTATKKLEYISVDGSVKTVNACRNRNIYPFFDNQAIYDGNPYYQMKGGWGLSNIMFDTENNIVDTAMYTETLNTVQTVNTIKELLAQPLNSLEDDVIYHVLDISGEYLIIDGYLYQVYVDGKGYKYITASKNNECIKLGETKFDTLLYVYNPYVDTTNMKLYYIPDLANGFEIRLYLNDDNYILAQDSLDNYNVIIYEDNQHFVSDGVFTNNSAATKTNVSNYFHLLVANSFQTLNGYGWNQLLTSSKEYIRINTIKNYSKGNNPHSGKNKYDNGFDYINNFAELFNYSYSNMYFDERPYRGTFNEEYENIGQIGFHSLIKTDGNNECLNEYFEYPDTKIHYFGNWYSTDTNSSTIHMYSPYSAESWKDYDTYFSQVIDDAIQRVDKNTIPNVCKAASIDGITSQIINTKHMKISFNLHSGDAYSKDGLEEIKYLQSTVLPYVYQMIPSTTIVEIEYI